MTVITNIQLLPNVWNADTASKANQNFQAIATKAGVFEKAINLPVSVPTGAWTDAKQKQPYRDVQKPDDTATTVAENAENVIAGRAVVDVYISDPLNAHVQYSYVLLLPHVDNTPENVANRKTIAQCGIDLVEHTAFDKLGTGDVDEHKKLCLLLQAVDARPTMDLKFDVLLF